jgi:hypothetical protein
MPWYNARVGRLYVFYIYNTDDVRYVPNNNGVGGTPRADSVGVIAYRSSVDGGLTWDERRELELPVDAIDLRNPWGGKHRLLWLTGHPVEHGDAIYLGLSKMGTVVNNNPFADTEAFVVKLTETAPGQFTASLSAPIQSGGPITEEPSPIVFDDGTINVAFRTVSGQQGEAWSTDDGATWDVDWARDESGDVVPQPRAKAAQFVLPDGRIFLWGHNNDEVPENTFTGSRNPVYYRLGHRSGDRIVWGPAQILLSDPDAATRISYPSLVVIGEEILIAATDKQTARLFRFPLVDL